MPHTKNISKATFGEKGKKNGISNTTTRYAFVVARRENNIITQHMQTLIQNEK